MCNTRIINRLNTLLFWEAHGHNFNRSCHWDSVWSRGSHTNPNEMHKSVFISSERLKLYTGTLTVSSMEWFYITRRQIMTRIEKSAWQDNVINGNKNQKCTLLSILRQRQPILNGSAEHYMVSCCCCFFTKTLPGLKEETDLSSLHIRDAK